VRAVFTVVSRLGDGLVWYLLIVAMPLLPGSPGPVAAARLALTGMVATGLHAVLKSSLARERPFVAFPSIACGIAPLDRYSFPSGHTLHAVCFTTIAVQYVPGLAWLLVPFTLLVMASRVVLGVHYPSDVVAGAVLGLLLAFASGAAFGV
jgi:undecaprenyl-diphosphatase